MEAAFTGLTNGTMKRYFEEESDLGLLSEVESVEALRGWGEGW